MPRERVSESKEREEVGKRAGLGLHSNVGAYATVCVCVQICKFVCVFMCAHSCKCVLVLLCTSVTCMSPGELALRCRAGSFNGCPVSYYRKHPEIHTQGRSVCVCVCVCVFM